MWDKNSVYESVKQPSVSELETKLLCQVLESYKFTSCSSINFAADLPQTLATLFRG